MYFGEVAVKRALLARVRPLVGRIAGTGKEEQRPAGQDLAEKNRRIKKLRKRLERQEQELAELRGGLARSRNANGSADGSGAEMPVFFIVGFAKSGTSWLMRILDGHPEILCTGEGLLFGRGTDLDKRRGTVAPSSLYGIFADSEYLRAWLKRSVWARKDDPERHIVNLTRMSIDYFLGEKLARSGKRIVGDKTPFVTEECIREIAEIYPQAKVVHIVRDGRDVAVSAAHHVWNHSSDAGGHLDTVKSEELAKRDAYRKDPEAFLASGESIFNEERLRKGFARGWHDMTARAVEDGPNLLGENYAEVRYEDLLERPEEEIGRILRFLGADAGEEGVRRAVEAGSFEKWAKGRERGREESTSFFRKGVAGDWRHVFTEGDRRVFKEEAGDLLIRLGYEKDDDW
jgi:hypothetical protein